MNPQLMSPLATNTIVSNTNVSNKALLLEKHDRYLKRRDFSPATVRGYRIQLNFFFKYLVTEEGVDDLKDVDKTLISRYQSFLFNQKPAISFTTQSMRIIALKSFYNYLELENMVLYDPTVKIMLPKRRELLPRDTFSENEVAKMISVVDVDKPRGLRDRAILEMLYSTGLRSAELCSLEVYDVNRDEKTVTVRRGKGGDPRTVPLGEIAMTYLDEYIRHERPRLQRGQGHRRIFLGQKNLPVQSQWIPRIVQRYAKKSGIERYTCAHMIRHSVATHMLRRKAPLRYIQELLGHKNLNTTQIYTQVEITDLKEVHQRTHPREINSKED